MGPAIAAAAQTGGGVISDLLGFASAYNARQFEREMSGTAHTREVADLRNAGLNPMLSGMGGQGASTPTPPMFTPDNPAKGVYADTIQNNMTQAAIKTAATQQSLNSASAARELANTEVAKEQVEQVKAQAAQNYSQAALNSAISAGTTSANVKKGVEARVYGAAGNLWDLIQQGVQSVKNKFNSEVHPLNEEK